MLLAIQRSLFMSTQKHRPNPLGRCVSTQGMCNAITIYLNHELNPDLSNCFLNCLNCLLSSVTQA